MNQAQNNTETVLSMEYGMYAIELHTSRDGWWSVYKDDSIMAHTPTQEEARRVVWLDMLKEAGITKDIEGEQREELFRINNIPLFLDGHHFSAVGSF